MLEHLQALAIHSFYAGEMDAGRRACERILSTPGLDQAVALNTRANRVWYTPLLAELAAVTFRQIDVEPAHPGWSLFNPTVLTHAGDLVGVVRSSNYQIRQGAYVMPEADGQTIRTQNLVVRFDAELRPVSCRPLAATYPKTDYPVDGLEDCRLRTNAGRLAVSATVRNVSPFDGRCRIAAGDLDLAAAAVPSLLVLDGVAIQLHEKNWMPIEGRGGWLYACNYQGHTVTVDPDPQLPGGWQMVRRGPASPLTSDFRGGSQLVPFRGGYLCLIHEVAHLGNHRVYEHRFVWFDENLSLARLSMPFAFREQRAIEFAAGLARFNGRLVASFGVRDAEAWLVTMSEEDVWQLLLPATSG